MKEWLRSMDRQVAHGAARFFYGRHLRAADSRVPDLSSLHHILIVRLDSIGDMVLTTPFLRELRRNAAQASITVVVRPAVHDLVALCPYVDRVLPYPAADVRPRSAVRALVNARRFVRQHLAHTLFDLALLPRWEDDAGFASLVALVSGARRRVGYREPALLSQVCARGPVLHEAARSLDLIRCLGGTVQDEHLELWIDDGDREFARNLLAAHDAEPDEVVIALGPGAAQAHRRWPLDRFGEVAAWSLAAHRGFVMVVGGADDRGFGDRLREQLGPRVINAAGRASLRGTAALLRHCALFVGNDSGPMHVAAAMGVPVVEVSCHPEGGAPDHEHAPDRFGPWSVPHRVVRPTAALPPCVDSCVAEAPHCIERDSAAQVIARAAELLS